MHLEKPTCEREQLSNYMYLPDIIKGMALVDDNVTLGTCIVLLQELHQTTSANCEQTNTSLALECCSHTRITLPLA